MNHQLVRKASVNQLQELLRTTAREILLPYFEKVQHLDVEQKADGSVLTAADTLMQQTLADGLNELWPQVPLMGEEMSAEQQQGLLDNNGEEGFWCLDPLDGTSNFASGMPLFAVSLAYVAGGEPQLGLIYDPIGDECFSAVKGLGAWCNDQPLRLAGDASARQDLTQCLAVVDLKRIPTGLRQNVVTQAPYRSQRNTGTCALEWCWLAAGRFQLYLHGGQKLWDYAAGSLIASEAGAIIKSYHNHGLSYDSLEPMPVVAAVNSGLHESWAEWVATRLA